MAPGCAPIRSRRASRSVVAISSSTSACRGYPSRTGTFEWDASAQDLKFFLCPRVDMGSPEDPARRHLDTDLEEITAGRFGGVKKGQPLATERMHDCLPDVSHLTPLFPRDQYCVVSLITC